MTQQMLTLSEIRTLLARQSDQPHSYSGIHHEGPLLVQDSDHLMKENHNSDDHIVSLKGGKVNDFIII